jgi:leucyl-tRNA synthetase
MEFVNHFYEIGLNDDYRVVFVKLLSPFAPHLSEELWSILGNDTSVFNESWPTFDTSKLEMSTIDIAVQINGKVRAIISIENNLNKEDVLIKAKEENKIKKYLDKKEIKKEIYIPGKIINFVVY